MRDGTADGEKFLSRAGFRMKREFAPDNLPLVEVANLYRNVSKNLWNSGSAVKDDRLQRISFGFDKGAKSGVRFFGFRRYPRPSKILFERRSSCREKKFFSDFRGIKNAHNRSWIRIIPFLHLGFIYRFPYPIFSFAILFSKIADGLPFPYMLVPYFLAELLSSPFVLKLFPAILTAVVLYISSLSILLYGSTFAIQALFLDMVCSF
jgi:hypothetical protein